MHAKSLQKSNGGRRSTQQQPRRKTAVHTARHPAQVRKTPQKVSAKRRKPPKQSWNVEHQFIWRLISTIALFLPVNVFDDAVPILGQVDDPILPFNILATIIWVVIKLRSGRKNA